MNTFGICWGNVGTQLLKIIDEVAVRRNSFHYVETGIAEGDTLATVCRHLDTKPIPWKATGVDLPNGWSLNPEKLKENIGEFQDKVLVNFLGSVRFFTLNDSPIDVYLCDSCHEKECVQIDFLSAAPHITPGGVIVFHDADKNCQGLDVQPHRGQSIAVREALEELGLLTDERKGWRLLLDHTPQNPEKDRGIVAVQRI